MNDESNPLSGGAGPPDRDTLARTKRWGWLALFPASPFGLILVGLILGVAAAVLQKCGNPPNMGICIACFQRDIAGAIGLHRAAAVQYLRPEIPALMLGAMLAALGFREFRPRGGSAPMLRFLLGVFAMIGSLVFLGCTWRAFIRLGGGDGTALAGIAGLAVGVGVASVFLRTGFSLGPARRVPYLAGMAMPAIMAMFLAFLVAEVSFTPGGAPFASLKGPGALHAPLAVSLGIGLLIGVLGQRSRFCTVGAFRDAMLIRNFRLAGGVGAMVVAVLLMNVIFGQFHPGMRGMPVAHSVHLWNFLGMMLAGLAFCLAGGCPGRQVFLCGEGDTDAAVFVLGAIAGAAVAHNWALAGTPDKVIDAAVTVGGVGPAGKIAVGVGLAFCLLLGLTARKRKSPAGGL